MKILLYLENRNGLANSGIGRAIEHQTKALVSNDIKYTYNPKDSYDLAHINSYGYNSFRILKRLKKHKLPVIVHGHSTHEDFLDSFRFYKLMAPFYNHMMNRMYKRADLIITPTPYSKRLIENYKFVKCPVVAISNGIDLTSYEKNDDNIELFEKEFDIKEDEKVIIGIGFPFRRKGLDDFVEIARSFPTVKFIWFGHLARILTSKEMLRAMKHAPDNVIFPGYKRGEIINGAMHRASALLFPTREETEGIVVLEALASKLPVITRDIGVYKDWLQSGINCYKAKTNEEFIEYIRRILVDDNSSLVENGYKLAKERNLTSVGKELEKQYLELLNKKTNHTIEEL